MACDGACAELRLLHSPWLPVYIGGFRFLSKSWFGSSEYHVLLTDMKCVWEERMGTAHIQERAQELNRRLRAPVSAFFSHLRQVAEPCLTGSSELRLLHPEAQMSLRRQEGGNIHLKLKSELGGLPFHWEFHCSPAPVTVVRSTALLRPLFSISVVLQRQVEQLGSLLVQKDKEIQDYRENGATLSRGTVQNTHRTHTDAHRTHTEHTQNTH
uniref:Non-homologous end-joining factor 1 n=1 Tax=Sphaeramia orbicularis TaxID=375764 RepID=A0A673B124_9TELE